jgi:branched-chain amino acid transport system permease protein
LSLWLQILISGLAAGSVYGLLAVGHTLVHQLTGIVHFALGDLVGLGVFMTLLVTAGSGPVTQQSASGGRFAVALFVGLIATIGLSWASYVAFIHPYLVRGSILGWVAASVAVAFAIEAFLRVAFVRPAYVFPDPLPFHKAGNDGVVSFAGATFQLRSLFVIAVGIALARAVSFVVRRTRYGQGLQAISQDREGARLVGVPLELYVSSAFAFVGALAVLIAVAAAPSGPFTVTTGSLFGLKGLVAALAVGFVAPMRAFVAGLVLGVVESAIASGEISGHVLIGPAWRDVIPIAFALLLLAYRPLRRPAEIE